MLNFFHTNKADKKHFRKIANLLLVTLPPSWLLLLFNCSPIFLSVSTTVTCCFSRLVVRTERRPKVLRENGVVGGAVDEGDDGTIWTTGHT